MVMSALLLHSNYEGEAPSNLKLSPRALLAFQNSKTGGPVFALTDKVSARRSKRRGPTRTALDRYSVYEDLEWGA